MLWCGRVGGLMGHSDVLGIILKYFQINKNANHDNVYRTIPRQAVAGTVDRCIGLLGVTDYHTDDFKTSLPTLTSL